ncbi:MAG TPA: MarR family winged helix-turn-helix transcriptional regulator [Myxococcota bacterium]
MEKVNQVDLSNDRALAVLHFAFRAVVEQPDKILARRGLSRVHHRILYFVRVHPDLSVGELLRILAVTKQALHKPLAELVDKGLVSSTAGLDRRVRSLALTHKGAALEEQISGLQREMFARAFLHGGKREWFEVMRRLAEVKQAAVDARRG